MDSNDVQQDRAFPPSDGLVIPMLKGRLGDSLRQLAWSVRYALEYGYRTIHLTDFTYSRKLKGFLVLKRAPCLGFPCPGLKDSKRKINCKKLCYHLQLPVQALPLNSTDCFRREQVCKVVSFTDPTTCIACSAGHDVNVWRRAFSYIYPAITPTARIDTFTSTHSEATLVIHLRGGDALTVTHPFMGAMERKMPPCAMYDAIISGKRDVGPPYKRVCIVTDDKKHPCVQTIKSRHAGVSISVQSKSREQDAAVLLHARYLVVAASYFSITLAVMNPQLRRLYYGDFREMRDWFQPSSGAEGQYTGSAAEIIALSTPGVEDYHKRPNSTQRVRWMVQYDINNVTRLLHKSYTPRQRNSYLRRPFRQGNDTDRRIASR